MISRLYYWLWTHASSSALARWLYVRLVVLMTVKKHMSRGNYIQALRYVKML